jgi:predicted nucleic acid-binding protein
LAIVVSDTSPIRALHHLDLLPVLADLYGTVFVPPAVVAELHKETPRFQPLEVKGVSYIQLRAPGDRQAVGDLARTLDPGESEAIALAQELGASLLIDEKTGRRIAQRMGLLTIGVVGVLLAAKARGRVMRIGPLLDRLRTEVGFRLSPVIRANALRLAGE